MIPLTKMKRIFSLISLLCLTQWSIAQDIAELYRKVNSSVVTVLTESKVVTENHQVATDDGIGSGVLISKDGEILTAAHVVNDAERIKVRFTNGEEIPAKTIKSAPIPDLALIKLAWMPKAYKIADIGNSSEVAIGDRIIIVGAPYGLENSLSVGYISGKETRQARTSGFVLSEFFQTDASINQGNSGGPMFNMDGEVVGISSYIITESGGFQGLGFAATSNLAKKLVIDGSRRWTGINGYLLTPRQSWLLNVPIEGGLLVESVVNFSPAYYAGLKGGDERTVLDGEELVLGGDIILAINDFPLTRQAFGELQELIKEFSIDDIKNQDSFSLKVLRGGKVETLDFEFKE